MATLKKMILSLQDLKAKGGEKLAVLSGDVHYIVDDGEKYEKLLKDIEEEKDEQKKTALELEEKNFVKVASFQMSVDNNPDLRRHLAALAEEAIVMREKKDNK